MARKFVDSGYECELCDYAFYGPGSMALAKKCEQNGVPPKKLEIGSKWEIDVNENEKVSVKILDCHLVPYIVKKIPVRHVYVYECSIFERFLMDDTSGVWRFHCENKWLSEDDFKNARKWKQKIVLPG